VDRPFRIGLPFWELPIDGWRELVQRYEQLGLSNITFTDHVELSTMPAKTIVGDHPTAAMAREAAVSGLSVAYRSDATLYLCGTAEEVCQRLRRWQEEAGISSVSLYDPGEEQIAYLAERVLPELVGSPLPQLK
jgi:alkanesulfonate monooxygenase SsuD/methylene tetrahydromethanopterin reductase-like flavin-dependent oxidoreductase (luciferase family)